jgi:magnesium transporter
MISTYKQNKVTWIDLENPTKEEVRDIMETYNLDPSVAEDLLDPTIRTRADLFEDFTYFVLHFPLHTYSKRNVFNKRSEEVDFIIGKDFLLTIHYSPIEALIDFSKSLETDKLLHHNKITKNSGTLFVHILYKMYKAVQDKVEDIHTTLNIHEERIFNGQEKTMVFELSALNRVLIYFRESVSSHKDILTLFERSSLTMFGKDFETYIHYITREYNKTLQSIISVKEYTDELRQTNDSLLSTKQNEIMKTLTVINFIVLPLNLIVGTFGMNTKYTPFVGELHGFWIIIGLMFTVGFVAFMIFKRKNWL